MSEIRDFKMLVGKTIKSVDAKCINEVKIVCTDGSSFVLDCDEQHYGIGVLNIVKTSKPIPNVRKFINIAHGGFYDERIGTHDTESFVLLANGEYNIYFSDGHIEKDAFSSYYGALFAKSDAWKEVPYEE
jgi:hypothetical protein